MLLIEFQESLKNLLIPNVSSELNFGMYKLLNLKKKIISDFIEKELENIIDAYLQKHNYSSKEQIYSDLYNFFSKYYKEGDLVVNTGDRYFVKTDILLRDYSFKVDNYNVVFKVVKVKDEIASNKPKKKFFVLDDDFIEDISDRYVVIRFQYKELSSTDQKRLNEEIYSILEKLLSKDDSLLIKKSKNGKPILLYHLNKFVAQKQAKDFFIHKDLAGFLTKELDYYVKSDVLDFSVENIARAKVVKDAGEKIVGLLSQIEDFQKRLWEKRRSAVMTEYIITLDRIKKWTDENFYEWVLDRIMENTKQLEEWEDLGFGRIRSREDLKDKRLPVDTRYFDNEFKFRLLEKISKSIDLEDAIDGLLIKSENWQALNTILNEYKKKIKTIYIDPPYNTGNDGFLYKDSYKHSTWLTMMENRLSLAKELMRDDGVIFVSIGDLNPQEGESFRLQFLQSMIFPKRFGNLIWKKRNGIGSFSEKNLTENHEYITVFGNEKAFIYKNIITEKQKKEYKYEDERCPYKWMGLLGPSQQTKERRPNLNYGIIIDKDCNIIGFEYSQNGEKKQELFSDKYTDIEIIYPKGNYTWLISRDVFRKYHQQGLIKVFKEKNGYSVKIKRYLFKPDGTADGVILKSILTDNGVDVGLNADATRELNNLFYPKDYTALKPKPTSLIKLLIHTTTKGDEIVCDFFAGSGTTAHAVMKLNKEDGGKRKFILVEMGDHFNTVIIPRIKKVAYSFNWKDGKPQDSDGIGGFFKYQILEQYEDVIDNLEDDSNYIKHPFDYNRKTNLLKVGDP